ncbi:hypothetical protein [Thiobaca trueperi]|uniref:Uncharacterized protein n=1 Tax=Thiobaca trueperi TaxID=127458 RepID=A0A4R3N513_9GAMM|nr:hypothetical protein [Thiobaca trueperi]TCT24105.1 hypothetical protein EDC35_101425 [Thiobaca trueperi]
MSQMPIRLSFLVFGLLVLALSAGFIGGAPVVTQLWPWPDGRLSYLFVASILAAFGVGSLLIAWTRDWRSAAGGGVALLFGFGGMAATLVSLRLHGAPVPIGYPLGYALVAVQGATLWYWGATHRHADTRKMPALVRLSTWVFAITLLLVGIALTLQAPTIFPWPLNANSSILYGWLFLGLALNYGYVSLGNRWSDAKVSLIGFLAYDLVLIVPFLQHFSRARPEHLTSLTIYTAVLIYSGALAVYYLFFDRHWRLWTR